MRIAKYTVAFAIISTPVLAQQQPQFVPYTLTEQEHNQVLSALGEIPAKYANPLIGAFVQREQLAQKEKAQEDAKKAEEKPKDKK